MYVNTSGLGQKSAGEEMIPMVARMEMKLGTHVYYIREKKIEVGRFTGGVQISSNGDINRTRISTLLSSDSDVPSHAAVDTPFHGYITVPGHPGQEGGQEREEKGQEGRGDRRRGVNDVREGGREDKKQEKTGGKGVKK